MQFPHSFTTGKRDARRSGSSRHLARKVMAARSRSRVRCPACGALTTALSPICENCHVLWRERDKVAESARKLFMIFALIAFAFTLGGIGGEISLHIFRANLVEEYGQTEWFGSFIDFARLILWSLSTSVVFLVLAFLYKIFGPSFDQQPIPAPRQIAAKPEPAKPL